MAKEQWFRGRAFAFNPQKVDVKIVDARLELGKRVQPRLGCAPVEPIPPIGDQLAHILNAGPVGSGGAGRFVREAGQRKSGLQIIQRLVGHMQ